MTEKEIQEYIQKLKLLQGGRDIERNHLEADDILCKIIIQLGYTKIIEEYNKINKRYA